MRKLLDLIWNSLKWLFYLPIGYVVIGLLVLLLVGVVYLYFIRPSDEPIVERPDGPIVIPVFDNRLDVFRADWDIYGPFQEWPALLSLAELSEAVYQDDDQDFRKYGFDSSVKVESPFHSHFAYIAHGEDVAVIVFRGTDEEEDWLSNANIYPRSMPEGSLHAGFAAAYGALRIEILSKLEQLNAKHIWITGHSLGGANALVCAYDLVRNENVAIDGVITFGQPRIGDEQFINFLQDKLGELHVHFVNEDDIVPKLPRRYEHCGLLLWFHNGKIMVSESYLRLMAAKGPETRTDNGLTYEPIEKLPAATDREYEAFKRAHDLQKKNAVPLNLKGEPEMFGSVLSQIADHSMQEYVDKIRTAIKRAGR